MVLQRWQSVWLLCAAICVALVCFMPVAALSFSDLNASADSATFITPSDNIVVLIAGITTAVLLLIDIFSFRDTRRQKMLTIVGIVLMVLLGVCATLMVYSASAQGAEVEIAESCGLLLAAVIFAILAYRGIRKDEKLIKSVDRLR